jgi:SAM-dependent methyltransferase
MDEQIAERLLRLNREFYQTFAESFAETREDAILDLGCGNGELARALAEHGHIGRYVGLDSSEALLSVARQEQPHPEARFENVDLADPMWSASLSGLFDIIVAFAVLHHIPSDALRLRLVRDMRALLSDDGWAAVSVWDFMASERLKARVVPWDAIELREQDVDGDDYLLDWRRGGYGLRYVHHFSETELTDLATQGGFSVERNFHSDGEGGRLGLYQVWRPVLKS